MAGSADGDGVSIDLHLPRRSLLVKFTCNLCSGRSERLVNPVAWNKGMVGAPPPPPWRRLKATAAASAVTAL